MQIVIDGVSHRVDRISKAFPETRPNNYIGLLDHMGHEIGMIQDIHSLDTESQELVEKELELAYFIPTIQEIRTVEQKGSGRILTVQTDVGERTVRIRDRNALSGKKVPALLIRDDSGKQYRVANYWRLDKESRKKIQDLLPLSVLRSRPAARRM